MILSYFFQVIVQSNAATRLLDLFLIGKIMVLVLAGIYVIFAVRVWVQVRRLEAWLTVLRGYGFTTWALIHVFLPLVGIGLILFLL